MIQNKSARWGIIIAIGVALGFGILVVVRTLTPPEEPPTLTDLPPPAPPPADQRPGSLTGTILNTEGKPAAGIEVRAERTEVMSAAGGGPRSSRPRIVTTITDAAGRFQFTDLESHKEYTVIAGSEEMGWVHEPAKIEPGREIAMGELKMMKLPGPGD